MILDIEQPLSYGSLYRFLPTFYDTFLEMCNNGLPYSDKFGKVLFKMIQIWKNPKCRQLIVHFRKIFRARAMAIKKYNYENADPMNLKTVRPQWFNGCTDFVIHFLTRLHSESEQYYDQSLKAGYSSVYAGKLQLRWNVNKTTNMARKDVFVCLMNFDVSSGMDPSRILFDCQESMAYHLTVNEV